MLVWWIGVILTEVTDENVKVAVIGLHSQDLNALRDAVSSGKKSCQIILPWRFAAGSMEKVMVTEQGAGGRIVMQVAIESIDAIDTIGQLRKQAGFKHASKSFQDLWLQKLRRDNSTISKRSTKKVLFAWSFVHMKTTNENVRVPEGFVRKITRLARKDLVPVGVVDLPQMRLKSTAAFFIQRLSVKDMDRLRETCSCLHNKLIRLGTTCSGTDVVINVFRETIACLNETFGASW